MSAERHRDEPSTKLGVVAGGAGESAIDADSAFAGPLARELAKLARFAELPPDWDSYGADPVSPAAIAATRETLTAVTSLLVHQTPSSARPSALAPLANGGIQIEWDGPSGELTIEVGPEGEIGFLAVERVGDQEFYHDEDAADLSIIQSWATRLLVSHQ